MNDNYRLAHYRFTFYNNILPAHTNKHTARMKTYKQTLSHTNRKIYNLSYKHTKFLYQITYTRAKIKQTNIAAARRQCQRFAATLTLRTSFAKVRRKSTTIIRMVSAYDDDQLIMMITKQSLPSSRQVQLATRLTAWSVAQVQLRPAQGGSEYYCTEILLYWNITVLEYYRGS